MKHTIRIDLIAGLILVSILLQNCASNDPAPALKEDVYLTGFIDDGTPNYSVVSIKNGIATTLGGGAINESANDITVDGNDIYVGGYTNDYLNMVYWKNGQKVLIPKDPNLGWEQIEKMTVVNGKKYLLAYGPGGTNAYRYYVDGTRTILPSQSYVADMDVASNGDVYIVGKNDANKAVYWKNGVIKELYNGDSDATAIKIVGSDVYICGSYINGNSSPVPVIWKNEAMTAVAEPGAYAEDMYVSGTNVYVVGTLTIDDSIVIWKNGQLTPIKTEGHSISKILDVEVKNDNVYFLTRDESTGNALLFKNGELLAPFNGTTYKGELYSIALK